jgi:hypothetical protein
MDAARGRQIHRRALWIGAPAARRATMTNPMDADALFWELAAELQAEDPRIVEGTIMNGRCLRVGEEFLALADFKGSGMVVKLPRTRVEDLVAAGLGKPFAPAGRVFKEWVSIPDLEPTLWRALLREGVDFVG